MRIGTPVNQVRLTNVAYVRLNKNGKRFEIAAYRNKVLSYRNKVETNLSEVLQIDTVFTNVTKGLLANSKDLIEAFGTADQALVCREILDKGELQVSEQERVALLDSTFRDVASIVADKAINPENNRPYTVSMIQNAMRQIHYSVNVSKSSKSQALDVIRKLKAIMPIARASMLLRVVCPSKYSESMKEILLKEFNVMIMTEGIQGQSNTNTDNDTTNTKDNNTTPNNVFMEFKFDTELFRKLEESVQQHTKNEGILEVLQLRTSSGPSDNTNSTTNTTTDAIDDTAIETDQVLPHIEKKTKEVISKSELKKLEKHNDFKIKGDDNDDDDDDDDDDENETVFGIVKKNKKTKKIKNKNDNDKNDNDKNDNLKTQDNDDDDDDDDKGDNKGAQKKSKKAKRLEKEEKKERDLKELKLKERLEAEKVKREATATATATAKEVADTTSNDTTNTPSTEVTTTTTSSSKCNTCGGSFPDAASYRAHFKSEWHRYNLNRKMKSLPIVPSEEEFAKLSFVEINAASISSGQTIG